SRRSRLSEAGAAEVSGERGLASVNRPIRTPDGWLSPAAGRSTIDPPGPRRGARDGGDPPPTLLQVLNSVLIVRKMTPLYAGRTQALTEAATLAPVGRHHLDPAAGADQEQAVHPLAQLARLRVLEPDPVAQHEPVGGRTP